MPAYGLVLLLAAAVASFGGVYWWSAVFLAIGSAVLAWRVRPRLEMYGPIGLLDLSLIVILAVITFQIIPLPEILVTIFSPNRLNYIHESSLAANASSFTPLTLDQGATVHAWLATFTAFLTFWTARTLFSRGGLRSVVTALAWTSVAFVIVAIAMSSVGSELVYGFWKPTDAGARPLGPFINRNHAGTWSVLTLFLCFGCLQWRRAVTSPSRGWGWRARVAHALDGRSLILVLAVLLLTVSIAVGASRSTMLGLGGAMLFTAIAAPRRQDGGRSALWIGAIALAACLGIIAYADLDRLLSRLDETRSLGLAQRVAIWRDTLGIIRDFPVTGVGAGNFATAMRLYQSTNRMYFWNEAHNHYLQVAAEGGLLLVIPVLGAIVSFAAAGIHAYRNSVENSRWMRLGAAAALIAVALQSLWETGLTLPASGMVAAVAAAILVHHSRHGSNASSRD